MSGRQPTCTPSGRSSTRYAARRRSRREPGGDALECSPSGHDAAPRIHGRIPRKLQTICLKCLRKRPSDRYETAANLAEDLGRWLCNEPDPSKAQEEVDRLGLAASIYRITYRITQAVAVMGVVALASVVLGRMLGPTLGSHQSSAADRAAKGQGRVGKVQGRVGEVQGGRGLRGSRPFLSSRPRPNCKRSSRTRMVQG